MEVKNNETLELISSNAFQLLKIHVFMMKNVITSIQNSSTKNNQQRFMLSQNQEVSCQNSMGTLSAEPKAFYLYTHENIPPDGKPWFINVPVGVNTLQTILQRCSLQLKQVFATLVTHYEQQLPIEFLQLMFLKRSLRKKTGHRSLLGLCAYERTTTEQEHSVTTCNFHLGKPSCLQSKCKL